MTDLMDLLSDKEIVPTAGPTSEPEPIFKTCPDCGAKSMKTGLPFITDKQVQTHRMRSHGFRNSSTPAQPAKKAPAKAPTATKAPPAKIVAKPKTQARRPLGESIARIVLQVGRVMNGLPGMGPTGAAIMFEAGALGVAVDRVIAGTIIDKPLQKGAAVAERFEPLVPLVTMPAMIFMLSRNPAAAGMIEGELREALEDVLVQSLPLLKHRAQRTAQTVNALAELKAIDPDLAASDDPIGDIMRGFFAKPPVVVEPDGDSGLI